MALLLLLKLSGFVALGAAEHRIEEAGAQPPEVFAQQTAALLEAWVASRRRCSALFQLPMSQPASARKPCRTEGPIPSIWAAVTVGIPSSPLGFRRIAITFISNGASNSKSLDAMAPKPKITAR